MNKFAALLKQRKFHFIASIVILVMAVGVGGFYYQLQQRKISSSADKDAGIKEYTALVNEVEKGIELPKGEEPIAADVSDKESLPKGKFFDRAQNGDKLLMYPKAKKVYLYRPSTKKVIGITGLNYTGDKENGSDKAVAATASAAEVIGITPGASSSANVPLSSDLIFPR